jgi:hypothetical protein
MSALPPKADIRQRTKNVRFVPKADILRRSNLRPYSIALSARPSIPGAFALDEFYARSAYHRILMFFTCV